MNLKEIKSHFLSVFRELFVHHHRSLEFRAKVFAAMIVAKGDLNDEYCEVLKKIANSIYKNDENRANILVNTTKEYVKRVLTNNSLNLDKLLLDIDKKIKTQKRFIAKIKLEDLKEFLPKNQESEDNLTQLRVYEFLEAQILDNI